MRRISDLPEAEARDALRACCASSRWVERMLSQRPFRDRNDVFDSAERIWWDLAPADWREAFAGHPRIGGTGGQGDRGTEKLAATWSAREQAGVDAAAESIKSQLAQANGDYEQRFGHIYVVCATGRSAEEMLAICLARLANEPEAELKVAAGEQAKITRLRLEKLLEIGS